MIQSNHRVRETCPAWRLAAACLAAMPVTLSRGDDVPVDQTEAARPSQFEQAADLAGVFDSMAFGLPRSATDGTPARSAVARELIAGRLAPLAQRAEARIAAVDRIVGLSDGQRRKLRTAAESDMGRLVDAVVEARGKYAGRTATIGRNGGHDEATRTMLGELSRDAQRVRRLMETAFDAESLQAKVVIGTLDDEQARKYAAVARGRADSRWKAVVAVGLAACDDQMGFTQKQHDAVMAAVLAAPPALEDDPASSAVAMPAVPAAVFVARRLAALDDGQLATLLDPRQRRLVDVLARSHPGADGGPEGGGMRVIGNVRIGQD